MYNTIEDAQVGLQTAAMDVAADHPDGEAAVEAGWADIVHAVADLCTPEVGKELIRRNL